MFTARVHITLKREVLDPQGETVKSALESLGFTGVKDVRMGKFLILTLGAPSGKQARERVEEMCQRLLANPVIEEYTVEIKENL